MLEALAPISWEIILVPSIHCLSDLDTVPGFFSSPEVLGHHRIVKYRIPPFIYFSDKSICKQFHFLTIKNTLKKTSDQGRISPRLNAGWSSHDIDLLMTTVAFFTPSSKAWAYSGRRTRVPWYHVHGPKKSIFCIHTWKKTFLNCKKAFNSVQNKVLLECCFFYLVKHH